jgi:hypothetical protein
MFYLKILQDSDFTDFLQIKRFFNVVSVELFLAFNTLIELSLINVPATPLCVWIHITKTPRITSIYMLRAEHFCTND